MVDTKANCEFLIEVFGLNAARIYSLPLAIKEDRFTSIENPVMSGERDSLRVLFVGTLIPLHGVQTILDAIHELICEPRFEFRIIGDGQLAGLVEEFLSKHPACAITWVREWCSLDQIADEVAAADICLGVFGGNQKAARVLPFKLYMYMASARAVISQSKVSMPENAPAPPIEAVSPGDATALASAIRRLAEDPCRRWRLAKDSRAYYGAWLANRCVLDAWIRLLARL